MQKFRDNDLFVIVFLLVIFFLILPFFYLHQGLLSVDTGREFYLAGQTALGGILYKNIFNIYGPFSYQFNALLFLIFGQKINSLYFAGIFNSIIILISLYLISREFLQKKVSFLLCITTMFSLVFNVFLYNSNITYSYAIIYALSSFMLSLLFLIKYIKNNNICFAYTASFFAGLCILNKYEFILYIPILIWIFTVFKPLNLKEKAVSLCGFLIMPVLSFGILFCQGLTLSELKHAFELMIIMANSDTMRIFYSNFGNFYNPVFLIKMLINNPLVTILGFLPIINIILFTIQIKKIYTNKPLFIFCICSIAACIKFLLFLNIEHMGAFLFPLCLLTTLTLWQNTNNIKYILLTGFIFFFAYQDFNLLQYKNYYLQTNKGNIYTFRKDGEHIKELSDYIINNTQPEDKIVILPEGTMINFLTERQSDNIYHTLLPLFYIDTFKEENVLNHFKTNPADYFIILPLSTIEYGSTNFYEYAGNFCEMINNNYDLIQDKNNIKIYKRKNL